MIAVVVVVGVVGYKNIFSFERNFPNVKELRFASFVPNNVPSDAFERAKYLLRHSFPGNRSSANSAVKMPPYTERIQLRSPAKSLQNPAKTVKVPENGISKKSTPQFKVEVSCIV